MLLMSAPPAAAAPATPPAAAAPLTLTKTDALATDVNANRLADPGDTLRYTLTVSNTGGVDLSNVTLSDTLDPGTTLKPGSLQVSPLALADSYAATVDTPLSVAAPGLLANDSGTPAPAVTAFSGPTTQGGSVSVSADGGFSYTPPAGYTGADSFSYTLTNVAGSDSATVSLSVNRAPTAVDDSYQVLRNTPRTVAAPGLLANDGGFPARR